MGLKSLAPRSKYVVSVYYKTKHIVLIKFSRYMKIHCGERYKLVWNGTEGNITASECAIIICP